MAVQDLARPSGARALARRYPAVLKMAEVLYYAIPFFVLLLGRGVSGVPPSRRPRRGAGRLRGPRHADVAHDGRSATSRSTSSGSSPSSRAYVALYELTPLRLDDGDWWVWVLLFFADDFSYYWFHRVSHESRVLLGEPCRPPLLAALQPLDRAPPDVGADDLLPVLAVDAARRIRAVHGPPRPSLVAHLPVLDPHRAGQQAPAADRGLLQHPVASPRPPRDQRAVPRPQLRRAS